MSKPPAKAGDSTRAVHAGERDHRSSDAVTTPIYQTSTFWFPDSETLKIFQEGRSQHLEYGRYGNPTWQAAERKLCELEGAEAAVLFASGMCAITTLFLAKLPQGSHMVITSDCYRRTLQFIEQFLTKMDVSCSVIDPSDTKQLAEAIRPETKMFFTESPTNPYLRVIDIAAVMSVCRPQGVEVVIDGTFATPANQRPLLEGADYLMHSATKYLGGHNDLLAGVVLGSAEKMAPVREAVGVLGGVLDPHAAYLLLRGLKTLSLRMARHNDNGLRVARYLEAHPKVRQVWYPGLPSHPDYAVASRVMQGFGGVVTFEVDSDLDGTCRFTDACRLAYIAPSFGGVETLIEMPAVMSFWDRTPEQRAEIGIRDALVRLSCGIEDADDIIADLDQALARL